MERRNKIVAGAVAVVATLGLGAGIAVATGVGDDDETEAPITGPALDEASRVALDHVGEGEVTDTEVGDEDSYYEVEVTLDDGSQVDVQLDEDFRVVSAEDDREEPGDDD